MKRRELIRATAAFAAGAAPLLARAAKPCPPPTVAVAGGTSASTTCSIVTSGGTSYSTGFDTNENPLSEGGRWQHLDSTLTVVKTVGGVAFGTQAGGAYDDSNAYMTGFGNNHEVEGVIWLNPSAPGYPNREVEILLHWTDNGPLRSTPYGSTRALGYEIMWSHIGAYLILGRFKGAELARASSVPQPKTGDRFRARIEGQRIRAYVNDVLVIDYTDSDSSANITSGNPGIGFYIDGGGVNTDFGYNSVTVRAL